MKRTILLLIAFAATAGAQSPEKPGAVRSWFPDGTGLEIYTESTGGTSARSVEQASRTGEIGIAHDRVNRVILDREKNMLFGYNLEAHRSPTSDAVFIRIEPLDTDLPRFRHIPTVGAAREFPAVRIGEVVTLETLLNPSTGEKIYDVIRPITDPSPAPAHPVVTAVRTGEQLSLKEIVVRVNGQPIDAPVSWMLGAAARIDIPGHGMFIVSANDPKNPLFHAAVRAEGNSLSWLVDGDRVEITSKTNALVRAEGGVLWVYHDSHYKSADLPDNVRLQTADSVEWLLPKR